MFDFTITAAPSRRPEALFGAESRGVVVPVMAVIAHTDDYPWCLSKIGGNSENGYELFVHVDHWDAFQWKYQVEFLGYVELEDAWT